MKIFIVLSALLSFGTVIPVRAAAIVYFVGGNPYAGNYTRTFANITLANNETATFTDFGGSGLVYVRREGQNTRPSTDTVIFGDPKYLDDGTSSSVLDVKVGNNQRVPLSTYELTDSLYDPIGHVYEDIFRFGSPGDKSQNVTFFSNISGKYGVSGSVHMVVQDVNGIDPSIQPVPEASNTVSFGVGTAGLALLMWAKRRKLNT